MTTLKLEKNNIPEGATHHGINGCDTDVYLKKDGDIFYQWIHDNWSISNFAHHKWVHPIDKEESVEWKNGDECVWGGIDSVFIGYSKSHPSRCALACSPCPA